ncbi:MAG: response regulator [Gammaproteobacteria bacterium]
MTDSSPRILFIDDEPKAGDLFRRYTRTEGLSCVCHTDPNEALESFQRDGADLVVTDLRMPGMHGMELLQRIRDLDAGVPVLIITGFSSEEGAIEALRLGASDLLRKPFDPDVMVERVRRLLAVSRAVSEDGPGSRAIDADQPTLAELERRYVLKTLKRCEGNRERTATALGIDKSTLWRKLKTYVED